MVLTRDRRRYHRSLYFTLFQVAADLRRAWYALPLEQRQVAVPLYTAIMTLVSWLEGHPPGEGLP
jgi:hypothetical protein